MATVRVYIDTDERYPEYLLLTHSVYGKPVDVDEETLERWGEAIRAFEEVQDEIEALYEQDDS